MPLLEARWVATARVPSGITMAWTSTVATIPGGFTRETSLDARYVKGVVNGSTDPGGTGGATTHDHVFPQHSHTAAAGHTHTSSSSSSTPSLQDTQGAAANSTGAAATHVHSPTFTSAANPAAGNNTTPANYNTTSSDPPFFEVIWIKSNGTSPGFPPSVLGWVNGSAPSGWTIHATSANRIFKGAASGADGGSTGGSSDSHSHTAPHTHPSGGTHTHVMSSGAPTTTATNISPVQSTAWASATHTHAISDSGTADGSALQSNGINLNNDDATPPWKKLLPVTNTSGQTVQTRGIIGIWLGTLANIPTAAGWYHCDGGNGTPSMLDKYVRGAVNSGEAGNTGGATTHTHAAGAGHSHLDTVHAVHTQTDLGTITGLNTTEEKPFNVAFSPNHTHTAGGTANNNTAQTSGTQTTSAAANTSNDPTFTRVAYVQFVG